MDAERKGQWTIKMWNVESGKGTKACLGLKQTIRLRGGK